MVEGSLHAKISSVRAATSMEHGLVMDRQTDRVHTALAIQRRAGRK